MVSCCFSIGVDKSLLTQYLVNDKLFVARKPLHAYLHVRTPEARGERVDVEKG